MGDNKNKLTLGLLLLVVVGLVIWLFYGRTNEPTSPDVPVGADSAVVQIPTFEPAAPSPLPEAATGNSGLNEPEPDLAPTIQASELPTVANDVHATNFHDVCPWGDIYDSLEISNQEIAARGFIRSFLSLDLNHRDGAMQLYGKIEKWVTPSYYSELTAQMVPDPFWDRLYEDGTSIDIETDSYIIADYAGCTPQEVWYQVNYKQALNTEFQNNDPLDQEATARFFVLLQKVDDRKWSVAASHSEWVPPELYIVAN